MKVFLQFTLLFSLSFFTTFGSPSAQSPQLSVKTEWVVQANANKKCTVIFQKKTAALKYFAEPHFVRILLLHEGLIQTSIKQNLQNLPVFKRLNPLIKRRSVVANEDEAMHLKG